jgi:Zn-dependent protease
MRKTVHTLLLAALFSAALMGCALADVATGPLYAVVIGVPLAVIAVAVIVIVLIVKAVKRKNAHRRDDDK